MPKKVAAILEAILIIKNIGATDSDTKKSSNDISTILTTLAINIYQT